MPSAATQAGLSFSSKRKVHPSKHFDESQIEFLLIDRNSSNLNSSHTKNQGDIYCLLSYCFAELHHPRL